MRIGCEFWIEADHPALAGHFPGNPLVPASLILDRVMDGHPLLRERSVRIESVKFLAPLRPMQKVRLEYRQSGPDRLSFVCHLDGTLILICKGQIALASPS
jgi:3-hydroxyacyl-[acyl-carrier-protein] dehydratase